MSENVRVTKSDLTDFAAAIFAAAGVAPEMAARWAEAVVWANLRGVDSHGVIRIPRYVDLLKRKSINPRRWSGLGQYCTGCVFGCDFR